MARLKQILARPDLGYFGVGLDNCKNGYNVGGVIRVVAGFGGQLVVVSGQRWQEKGNWKNGDTEGGYLRIPVFLGVEGILRYVPEGAEIVGVELTDDASNIVDFVHPKVGFYVFGPEDGTLNPCLSEHCKSKIYIPTTYCLNLASAVTAVCYDRMAKENRVKIEEACPQCGGTHYSSTNEDRVRHCNACGSNWALAKDAYLL